MSDIFNGIEEGSVIKVKFKSLVEITKDMKMSNTLNCMGEYEIGGNINLLILGGDFIVVDIDGLKNTQSKFIEIENHLDGGTFSIYEELVESIEIVDVANKFVSVDHGILMIQVDDKLYINGEVLDNGDPNWPHTERDHLDKFMKFMETFMISRAFEGGLDGEN